jgi:hypothetical protein
MTSCQLVGGRPGLAMLGLARAITLVIRSKTIATFKHLFNPFKIGSLDVPNRVFMSPHGMVGLGIGTDAQVGSFEARAKGGCGFMVIASCQVLPAPLVPPGWFIEAHNRDHIPAISRTAGWTFISSAMRAKRGGAYSRPMKPSRTAAGRR